MKSAENVYVTTQIRFLKALCKTGETATYGESDEFAYFGTSYYMLRIPKRFLVLDKEKLAKVFPTTFRTYEMERIFMDAVAVAQTPASDTGMIWKKDKRNCVILKTAEGVEYNIDEKFMKVVKDFNVDGYRTSGKPNTPVILTEYGQPFAMILPVRVNAKS